MTPPATSTYVRGVLFGLAAASIWASWSAFTRLAVTTQLSAWDIAALRFGVAGVLLFPVVLRRGLAYDRLGWRGLAILVSGAGVPYVLLAAEGLRFAPAHDQGALNPGVMPLFVALIAAATLREKLSVGRKRGLLLIFIGMLLIVGWHAGTWRPSRTLGHGLSLSAAFLWACFTVVLRRAKIEALHAAALVSTTSLLAYLPIYLAWQGVRLAQLPIVDLALQTIFQGVLVTVVSLILYGRAIAILGAASGAAFGAVVPALSALIAIPLLGEWPNAAEWIAIALISAGVYLASGGPLPGRRQRHTP